MRLCYVLLSPTWGMHQYAADVANRMAMERGADGSPFEVHLVTTQSAPRDRYAPEVIVHTPVTNRDAGFSVDGLRLGGVGDAQRAILGTEPDLVHFCGAHLWNPLLLRAIRRVGVPTVHDLHDLHPHAGAVYGRLLYLWNRWVQREADHLLVHGECFREELMAQGVAPGRVTCTRLTFPTGSYAIEKSRAQPLGVQYEPWALFIGRLLPYKGLDVLVEAARRLDAQRFGARSIEIVIGGPGRLEGLVQEPTPANVEVRNRLIIDDEAVDLLRRCGMMVLPYIEASNSALVATAYSFQKPVIVTRAGALPEYVVEGQTGWIVPPGDAGALARCLEAALGDPERLAQMGRAGRAWYEQQRQAEEMALREMYARLFERD